MRLLPALCLLLAVPTAGAETRAHIGLSIADGGLRSFYLALSEHYRVPHHEVVVLHEKHVPPEEIPVVLYLAQRARVSPEAIIHLRYGGRSWLEITLHYGLGPEIYYVPVHTAVGPPYGQAYGYYARYPRKHGRKIVLSDDEVVNLVNLKFISAQYGYPPEAIIRERSRGRGFVAINESISKTRAGERKTGKTSANKRGSATATVRVPAAQGPVRSVGTRP